MIEYEAFGTTWFSYIFLGMLGLRALSQYYNVTKYSGFKLVTILALLMLYIISMYGVFLRMKWGSKIAIIISIIEIPFVFAFTLGYYGIGVIMMNLTIIGLGYLEYITCSDRGSRIANMW
ncbi:MAG: hypothetical protein ACYTFZ_06445 [Planctomycetota bacterium]